MGTCPPSNFRSLGSNCWTTPTIPSPHQAHRGRTRCPEWLCHSITRGITLTGKLIRPSIDCISRIIRIGVIGTATSNRSRDCSLCCSSSAWRGIIPWHDGVDWLGGCRGVEQGSYAARDCWERDFIMSRKIINFTASCWFLQGKLHIGILKFNVIALIRCWLCKRCVFDQVNVNRPTLNKGE